MSFSSNLGTGGGGGGFMANPFAEPANNSNEDNFVFHNDAAAAIHGVGDHLMTGDNVNVNGNVHSNAAPDGVPVLNAEDQAFLDHMFPIPNNEHHATQATAGAAGGGGNGSDRLETREYPREQQVVQEDTVMQSIEHEDNNNNDDNQARATAITLGDGGGSDGTSDYSPPFDFNTIRVPVPTTNPPAAQQQQQQQQQSALPSFPTGFGATATTTTTTGANNTNVNTTTTTTSGQGAVAVPSRRVDYFFGPHAPCPIEREHGHDRTDGSIVFRDEAACRASFLAMQQNSNSNSNSNEGGGGGCGGDHGRDYFRGLADGIEAALTSPYTTIPTTGASASANATPRATHDANGVLWNRTLRVPDPTTTAHGTQSRLPWRRTPQSTDYYDVLTGCRLNNGEGSGSGAAAAAARRAYSPFLPDLSSLYHRGRALFQGSNNGNNNNYNNNADASFENMVYRSPASFARPAPVSLFPPLAPAASGWGTTGYNPTTNLTRSNISSFFVGGQANNNNNNAFSSNGTGTGNGSGTGGAGAAGFPPRRPDATPPDAVPELIYQPPSFFQRQPHPEPIELSQAQQDILVSQLCMMEGLDPNAYQARAQSQSQQQRAPTSRPGGGSADQHRHHHRSMMQLDGDDGLGGQAHPYPVDDDDDDDGGGNDHHQQQQQ